MGLGAGYLVLGAWHLGLDGTSLQLLKVKKENHGE